MKPLTVEATSFDDEIELFHSDSTSLYGLLESPASNSPLPIVIFVAGSGPTDHNGNSGLQLKSDAYKMLATGLHSAGYATLRYDKRTAAKSKIHPDFEISSMTFDKLVEDLLLFLDFVDADKRLSDVILVGHSQGSLLTLIAAQSREIKSIVSLAGAGNSIDLILADQFQAMGLDAEQAQQFEKACVELKGGNIPTEYPIVTASIFNTANANFMRTWMNYNPTEEIRKLKIPILIINGTTDIQVPITEAELLHEANPNSELLLIEGMNHILKDAPMDRMQNVATYSKPELPLSNGLLSAITKFLNE